MSSCPFHNALDPDFYANGMPYAELAKFRQSGPILKIEDAITGVPYWLVTRQKELDFISKNPKLFSSQLRGAVPWESPQEEVDDILSKMIINMDPPRQQKVRRVIRDAFIPKAVESYAPEFREHAKAVVDAVADRGECEFVRDVAAELPLMAILGLFDVPVEDRQKFFEWTNIMFFADDPDVSTGKDEGQMAAFEIINYALNHIQTYKENPKDNIVGALLSGEVDGVPISEEEFCWIFVMSIVAGNESTRTGIAQGMRLLMEHPDQLQYLVDNPAHIPQAIEEMLRYNTAFTTMRRTVVEDVELGGEQLRAGDKVILHYHTVNQDEAVFGEDATEFDIHRVERHPSLSRDLRSFGIGQHFCLGAHLARLEMRIMFEEILPRLRNPLFAGEVKYMRSNFVNGIKEMPISFDRESPR